MEKTVEKKQYIISVILTGLIVLLSLASMINIDGNTYNAFQLVKEAENGNIPALISAINQWLIIFAYLIYFILLIIKKKIVRYHSIVTYIGLICTVLIGMMSLMVRDMPMVGGKSIEISFGFLFYIRVLVGIVEYINSNTGAEALQKNEK